MSIGMNILDVSIFDEIKVEAIDINDHGQMILSELFVGTRYFNFKVWDEQSMPPWYENRLLDGGQLAISGHAINNEQPPVIVGDASNGDGFRKVLGDVVDPLYPGGTGSFYTSGRAVNDLAEVVGYRTVSGLCNNQQCTLNHGCVRALLWEEADFQANALLSLDGTTNEAKALDNNIVGNVVGYGDDPYSQQCPDRALFWRDWSQTSYEVPQTLPFLSSVPDSEMQAYAVNDPGCRDTQVVGRDASVSRAVLWIGEYDAFMDEYVWEAHDLNDLTVCGDPHPTLTRAVDINNAGWIIAHSGNYPNTTRSFLLIPMDNCPADINLDGVVDVSDLLALLGAWGPKDDNCHVADLNNDGTVDVSDLLILLANWGPCCGFPTQSTMTLEDSLEEAGLTMNEWDAFVTVMTESEDEREKENWLCWMENYLMQCVNCPQCPGPDPFAN